MMKNQIMEWITWIGVVTGALIASCGIGNFIFQRLIVGPVEHGFHASYIVACISIGIVPLAWICILFVLIGFGIIWQSGFLPCLITTILDREAVVEGSCWVLKKKYK